MIVAVVVASFVWFNSQLGPGKLSKEKYLYFDKSMSRKQVVQRLVDADVIANYRAFDLYAQYKSALQSVKPGMYKFVPNMTVDQVIASLNSPIRQMVRLPEGWWIARTAKRLEENKVCTAQEYIDLANDAEKFRKANPWLPKQAKTLEGFLYPDTYDLPPTLGAERVINLQLATFKKRVLEPEKNFFDLYKIVTIASMVELEAKLDSERPMVSGVIHNRVNKSMRLEIDATVLYALQEWKVLGPGIVGTVDSPYNTYRNSGLPPGPIGSPSQKSIQAAMNPQKHGYLYYVAKGDLSGGHLFAPTYSQHLANIRIARRMKPPEQN